MNIEGIMWSALIAGLGTLVSMYIYKKINK